MRGVPNPDVIRLANAGNTFYWFGSMAPGAHVEVGKSASLLPSVGLSEVTIDAVSGA